jgi:hypothetical protein
VQLFSSDLKKALATTVALAGGRGEGIRVGGGSLSDWAAGIVAQLLRRANADAEGQLWASLDDVLPLLAEAAPNQFLDQVSAGLNGEDPVLRRMFTDDASAGFTVASPHTALLWALETLAWSGDHVGLVTKSLARLVEIDPGGKLANRPIESLTAIFLPQVPQTSVGIDRRLAILDVLRRDHGAVAWQVMIRLLPGHSWVGTYAAAPRFRDWKPDGQTVSRAEYLALISALVE